MKSQLPHVLFINFYFLNILRNDIDNHDLDYILFSTIVTTVKPVGVCNVKYA